MILEDFSMNDNIDSVDSDDNIEFILKKNQVKKNQQNIDLSVDNNNNLIISLNLTKNVIKNIKKNSTVKLEFQLSKEFYLSILNDFK